MSFDELAKKGWALPPENHASRPYFRHENGYGCPWMVVPGKKDDPLFHTFESNINMLIPMNEQGKDGLGTPIKHLLCRIRKETKNGSLVTQVSSDQIVSNFL